ncbi:helix-turn-helix domain-containing protein [Bacillus toyonensis]|uniref:helix-turn-helix domain-containing protein n=1 Tax=Bacillus toyonensis TaxID=155322 RepID=UPI00027BEAA7|nr:helix-turn-helix transcriptional regulator [Bacillus toyonensis]EJV41775.1 hypothetical protein IEA_05660 [Bacillus toyonensis]
MKGLKHRIKNTRKARGMRQDDLAALIDRKRCTISNWETGEANPSLEALCSLSRALNVTTDFLLLGDK